MSLKGQHGAAVLLGIYGFPIACELLHSSADVEPAGRITQALPSDAAPNEVEGEGGETSGDTTLTYWAGSLTSLGSNVHVVTSSTGELTRLYKFGS